MEMLAEISTGAITASVVAVVVAIAGCVGAVTWIARKATTAALVQNKRWVDGALDNFAMNTEAIKANTNATNDLSRAITDAAQEAKIVRDERDKSLFKQLDRMETKIERIVREDGRRGA